MSSQYRTLLVCCRCMAESRHARAAAQSPLTIIGGNLVCADHLPTGPPPRQPNIVINEPTIGPSLAESLARLLARRRTR